jgi:hypothetical protein
VLIQHLQQQRVIYLVEINKESQILFDFFQILNHETKRLIVAARRAVLAMYAKALTYAPTFRVIK